MNFLQLWNHNKQPARKVTRFRLGGYDLREPVFIYSGYFLALGLFLFCVGCSRSEAPKLGKPRIITELRSELDFGEFAQRKEKKDKKSSIPMEEAGLFGRDKASRNALWEDASTQFDPDYLALTKFEPPPGKKKLKRTAAAKMKPITQRTDTIRIQDKPLILGGRGFELRGFEEASRQKLFPGFYRIVSPPLEPDGREPKEKLDLSVEKLKENMELIFHTRTARFGKIKFDLAEEEFETKVPPKKVSTVPAIDETKILLSQPKDEMLILQPGEQTMDLLIGHEEVNRAAFWGR